MCGICGEIRFDHQSPELNNLHAMQTAMAARGPDAAGLFMGENLGFAHRRLKVMDLSNGSAQPMIDQSLGLGLVFNGAIYNYPELRRELVDMGYQFTSNGDTEVILKAFHAWGKNCVQHFQGMFAFAAWELESGKLILARDRLGIKPLYYCHVPQKYFRFASSLPAILAAGEVDTDVDPIALNHYLSFHAVVPAPATILKGVKKLPPAHTLTIEPDGTQRLEEYWRLDFNPHTERSEAEWIEALDEQLKAAVRRRLVAAVDVGVLLSGGVDSSLLVGLIAEAGISKFSTYSVGFESIGDEIGDEFKYSDIVAEHFSTDHHQIRISASELETELPNAIRAMAEPMVSHDCIGFYLLSREVAKTCKAVQSGQGADEVFGGYHWYPPLLNTSTAFETYRTAFFDRDFDEYRQTVYAQRVEEDYASAYVKNALDLPGAAHAVDKALRLDTTVMLVDDPVKRVDNMTMAWGLEARVPFLDHQLVEFAATIPAQLKVQGEGKYILKETARAHIPSEVIDRPKGYFPVPALKYLRGSLLETVRDALTNDTARARRLFEPSYVEMLCADPEAHITPLRGSKLWQLGLLEMWLQSHGI